MKYDGIIFDVDGTLWSSVRTVTESWRQTLSRFGISPGPGSEDVRSIMGATDIEIEQRIFSRYGDMAHMLCATCMAEEPDYIIRHGGDIYPGVEEMLEKLYRLCPLFIVSNCQQGYVEAFLEYSGFGPYFRDYEYLGRRGLSKAENIRLLMDRHSLSRSVYVGDTAHDEESSRYAGCDFVFASYGFGCACAPDAVIQSPSQLPQILKTL